MNSNTRVSQKHKEQLLQIKYNKDGYTCFLSLTVLYLSTFDTHEMKLKIQNSTSTNCNDRK